MTSSFQRSTGGPGWRNLGRPRRQEGVENLDSNSMSVEFWEKAMSPQKTNRTAAGRQLICGSTHANRPHVGNADPGWINLGYPRGYPSVKLCLSGHTHLTETISFGSIDFVNSGAVCGLWRKGKYFHTSEGYNVVDLYD